MQRILLLMTTRTYKAGAFLDAAERLGVQVAVGTNQPQVLAGTNPGGMLSLDFQDIPRAVAEIVGFSRKYPIDAVVGADDDSVLLAAGAAAALGLPHNSADAIRCTCNKLELREAMRAGELRTPSFFSVPVHADPERVARDVVYPCVLKPLSFSASRGVIRANNAGEFVAAFKRVAGLLARKGRRLQKADRILIEAYIPGVEVAVEGLLHRSRLQTLAIFDKPDPLEGPYFEETIYVTPSRLPFGTQRDIIACVAEAVAAIGLQEGPIHAEVRHNRRGAWLIEIAARSIGGLCSRALRFEEDQSLETLILRQALGEDVAGVAREAQASGVMMIPVSESGTLQHLANVDQARQVPFIEDIRITVAPGQQVLPAPESDRYLGFIFARAPVPAQVEEALRQAHNTLEIKINKSSESRRHRKQAAAAGSV